MKSQAKDNITPEESQRRETQPHYHHHQENPKKNRNYKSLIINISYYQWTKLTYKRYMLTE